MYPVNTFEQNLEGTLSIYPIVPSYIPSCILTFMQRFMNSGATDVYFKPFDMDKFTSYMKELAGSIKAT